MYPHSRKDYKMNNENKPIFGVDIDGVLADLMSVLKKTAEEILEVPYGSLPDTTSWGFKEWGIDYPVLFPEAVRRNDMFLRCPTIDSCVESLRNLREQGWHIRIITHRGSTDKRAWLRALGENKYWLRDQTYTWLEENEIPYDDIFFEENKVAVEADVYIDDDPNNIELYYKHRKQPIFFKHLYTSDYIPPHDVWQAETWAEVVAILGNMQTD